jgi:uncharacterized RDD family membrane protein YckC
MKNNQTYIIVLALAIIGILAKVVLVFPELNFNFNQWVMLAIYIVSPFQLELFEDETLRLTIGSVFRNLNMFEAAMLLTTLLAALFYKLSNKKEVRLITFVLCLIFLNQLACFIMNTLAILLVYMGPQEEVHNYSVTTTLISLVKPLVFVIGCYRLLEPLVSQQSPQITSTQYDTFELKEHVMPSKWVRIFHLWVDIGLLVLIYSIYILGFLSSTLKSLEQSIGARPAAISYFLVVSFLYYAVSEWLFGATPGKMLSQTRVVDLEGNKASLGAILGRTLYRRIPFNALSFLGNNGWHDKISSTQVVYIENKGVKGSRYWLLVLLFILMFLGILFGEKAYFDYKVEQEASNEYKKEVLELEGMLQKLGSNHILSFLSQEDQFDIEPLYFKIERTTPDSVYGYYLPMEDTYWCSSYLLERRVWEYQKSNPTVLAFSRNSLLKAYPKTLQDKEQRENSMPLPEQFSPQYLERIYTLGAANIKNSHEGRSDEPFLHLGFYNDGWPATITKVTILKGSIQIQPKPMIEAPIIFGSQFPGFMIGFENYKRGEPYEFTMEVTDSAGKVQHYQVKGVDLEKEIYNLDN